MKKFLFILGIVFVAISTLFYALGMISVFNYSFNQNNFVAIFISLSSLIYFICVGFLAKFSFLDKLFSSLLVSLIGLFFFINLFIYKEDLFITLLGSIFIAICFYFLWSGIIKLFGFSNKKNDNNSSQKQEVLVENKNSSNVFRFSKYKKFLNKYTISIFILLVVFIISFVFFSRSKERNIFCLGKINYSQKLGYYIKISNQNKYFKTQKEAKEYCYKVIFPSRK